MKNNNQYNRGRIYNKSFLSILVLFLITFSFNCVWADSGNSISTYIDTVQKIFIGYYQRPADPEGLLYWAAKLDARAGNLNEIIEAFGNSAESQALYGTITSSNISTVVTNIYSTLFGRSPDTAGLNYYVNGFNSGQFTAATIMLNVLNGAQNEDLLSVNNKLTAANLFTKTIDPELDGTDFQTTYSGNADAQKARDFLSTITFNPVTIPTQAETTLFVKNNIADPGDPITAASDVAAVLQSTGSFGALMVGEDGEMLLPIVDRDASGNATKITGALWINNVSGTSVVVYLGDDGKPMKAVMGNYILLFSNWSADGNTADIAKIYTPTNYIEVFKRRSVNANLAANRSVSPAIAAATCFPACDTDTKNLAELLKIAGLGISVGACGVATTVSLGAMALPCAAVIVTTASLVVGNETWLGNLERAGDILGAVDVFQCVLLDPVACISAAIDMSSRTFGLLDLTLDGNSGLVTTANIFLSNPSQPSGVVQQGGGLPSCPGIYECTPGGAMSYLPCYPEGVRQCGASCTWGPCVSACGDGICDPNLGETTNTCPGDCPLTCGDNFCNVAGGELQSCPQDCPQNQCCVDTNGCPSETPYECGASCCCCGWGQTCCWTAAGWVCCGG